MAGWGGSFRLPRRVGPGRAKQLFFTARILEAREAYEIGLVDIVTPAESLDSAIMEMVTSIRQVSPLSLKHLKYLVDHSFEITQAESYADEAAASSECMASQDTRDRVAMFLQSRQKR